MEAFDLFPRGAGRGQTNAAAERAIDAAAAYFSARSLAAFSREHDHMFPVAVRGADQRVQDAILRAWSSHRSDLAAGRALYGAATEMDPEHKGGTFVLAPLMQGEDISGLLYVQADDPRFHDPKDLDALV